MDSFLTIPLPQPKLMVADYVESEGQPVPEHCDSCDDALASGDPFIVRSEHPQEYAGASGLLTSFKVTAERLEAAPSYDDATGRGSALDRALLRILQKKLAGGSDKEFESNLTELSGDRIDQYCRLMNVRRDDFLKDLSYSYWKLLGGYNQSIIADNAVPGRYHVFTTAAKAPSVNYNYCMIEGARVILSKGSNLGGLLDEDAIIKGAATFVDYYESVRWLKKFDPSHCPIIECQWVDGVHYFLQYHRTRDAEPARFKLTEGRKGDEVEALFVRGATPPEGIVVNAAISTDSQWRTKLFEYEEASYNWGEEVYDELMTRRRCVQLMNKSCLEVLAYNACVGHLPRSFMFKPRISVVTNFSDESFRGLSRQAAEETRRTGVLFCVPLLVRSDGRRALARILR